MFSPLFSTLALAASLVLAEDAIMDTDMTPDNGPEMDTVYIPGTAGAEWTSEEVETTRKRVLKILTPVWSEKEELGLSGPSGRNEENIPGEVSENVMLRLVFHDCIPYTDGTGGCDGCLNWNHMDSEIPNPNSEAHWYKFTPANATDNRGLDGAAIALEMIYTTLDWPFQNPSLGVSLYQSGKSRADLWQFAGLVALELALERANRACDLDFHARQQVTLLEGREKCEIKLTAPLKFQTGRKDCISDDPEGRGFVTYKEENQPKLMSSGHEMIDYGRNFFDMDALHFSALMGIHGAVHKAAIGLKYTWMGSGYISNTFFKQLANKPMYSMGKGGDLSFTSCGEPIPVYNVAIGDKEGNPQAYHGWRTSCMYLWNATHGGPCVLRPTHFNAYDSPFTGNFVSKTCLEDTNEDGSCVISSARRCSGTYCNEDNVLMGGRLEEPKLAAPSGAWREDLPMGDKGARHNNGFSNQFAFPWEVGMMYNFSVGYDSQIPVGCEGIDEPFGELPDAEWPLRNMNSPIWATGAMKCNLNDYAPEGTPMYQIIDDLASDNEYFAEKFLDAYGMMISNGYTESELTDGPENGWLGHYSLSQQGIDVGDFTSYIAENSPVTFTDKNTDPWICGHRGHSTISCGVRFSKYFEISQNKFHTGDGCDLMP